MLYRRVPHRTRRHGICRKPCSRSGTCNMMMQHEAGEAARMGSRSFAAGVQQAVIRCTCTTYILCLDRMLVKVLFLRQTPRGRHRCNLLMPPAPIYSYFDTWTLMKTKHCTTPRTLNNPAQLLTTSHTHPSTETHSTLLQLLTAAADTDAVMHGRIHASRPGPRVPTPDSATKARASAPSAMMQYCII